MDAAAEALRERSTHPRLGRTARRVQLPVGAYVACGGVHAGGAGALPDAGVGAGAVRGERGGVARRAGVALSERRAGGDGDRQRAGVVVAVGRAGCDVVLRAPLPGPPLLV